MSSENYFSEEQQQKIMAAIKEAEKNTSGEIRVHIEKKCSGDSVKRAGKIFHQLGMDKTAQHNGILFYLAFQSHDFALVGDKGIHEKVGSIFWEDVKNKTLKHFKEGDFTEGLSEAILECGQQLKKHFPYSSDDKNELSDTISFN